MISTTERQKKTAPGVLPKWHHFNQPKWLYFTKILIDTLWYAVSSTAATSAAMIGTNPPHLKHTQNWLQFLFVLSSTVRRLHSPKRIKFVKSREHLSNHRKSELHMSHKYSFCLNISSDRATNTAKNSHFSPNVGCYSLQKLKSIF